ncbi:hypothetical protein BDD12DRAFT_121029 [Trichophaea hybrida]|nr:hypothetical protein BDD12DRAFT_121029 [Trichophaea hybrida]
MNFSLELYFKFLPTNPITQLVSPPPCPVCNNSRPESPEEPHTIAPHPVYLIVLPHPCFFNLYRQQLSFLQSRLSS